MTPERWARIDQVFQAAADMESAARARYLDEACAGDEELRREVASLLDFEDAGGGAFEDAVAGTAEHLETASIRSGKAGPYQLGEVLGTGGMGTVYLAEREEAGIRRKVAVKVVRRGLESGASGERFARERRILARLEHPNIGRIVDGGSTAEGLPYLVMEYIDGAPIHQWARERKLSIAARLELFRQVCGGVEYAHRNLVLHCDLKPSNLLVDSMGVPKLVDFGIARLMNRSGSATLSDGILTPYYASPEQMRGERLTTASDVYSLGVVLFELLAGKRPYGLDGKRPAEVMAAVEAAEPGKPSEAAGEGGRELSGDLDNIVLMALRKEPERRYASAAQLGEDLRRHLASLPVAARGDSLGYRAGRFLRRWRWAVGAGAVVAVSLGVAIGVSVRETQRATRRFEDVRHLARAFLFEFDGKVQGLAGAETLRGEIAATGLRYLDSLAGEASGDDGLAWELGLGYERVAQAQRSLKREGAAVASYRKALALLDRGAGGGGWDRVEVLSRCSLEAAKLAVEAGKVDEAERWLRAAVRRLDAAGKAGGAGEALLVEARAGLARIAKRRAQGGAVVE